MSDTPRTDNAETEAMRGGRPIAETCRQLERELAEANARLEQKINDAFEFVEGMKIMELHRISRGMVEQVDVMKLLDAIQTEIRRPILHLEETK